MIEVIIKRDDDTRIRSIKTSGHSGSAPRGQDIVCAGVSALIQTAVLSLKRHGVDVAVSRSDGFLEFLLPNRADERISFLLESIVYGLQAISEQYPSYVRISQECIDSGEVEGMMMDLQLFAHKKGVGSSRNGRDSNAKRLGLKRHDGQTVKAGTIIVRQNGTSIHAGNNVGRGRDNTLFALADGIVSFERMGKTRKRVSIEPQEVAM